MGLGRVFGVERLNEMAEEEGWLNYTGVDSVRLLVQIMI